MNRYSIYKWGLLYLAGVFIFQPLKAQDENSVENYIREYKDLAIQEMVRTGVPAAISLAQGIIESGAGTTWLSVHANNQFGIKCKSTWQGESVSYTDDHKNECFRKYLTIADSWRDHSDFLKNNRRYRFLFYLDPLDYKAWAYGLKEAGYATSKRYARQIIQTIQNYDLEQFSERGLALSKDNEPEEEFASMLNKKIEKERPRQPDPSEQDTPPAVEKKETFPQNVFEINRRKVVYLPEGTQLIAVAENHHIPLRRLLRFNELSTDVLPKNMLIFLEKKRKKGDHADHKVLNGESFHQIAQEEGIRLKWLLKRNHLPEQAEPQPGQILVLKGYATSLEQGERREKGGFFSWLGRIFSGTPEETRGQRVGPPVQQKDRPAVEENKNNTFVYTVRSGDTLYGISQKYQVSIDRIREKNDLKGNIIKTGQKLLIPQEQNE